MQGVNLFFSDATAAIVGLTLAGNRVHEDVDNLKLIGIYLLRVVEVLIVASDHLQLDDWLVINLDAAVLLLVAFEQFVLGCEGFWELIQICLAVWSTHETREDAIRELKNDSVEILFDCLITRLYLCDQLSTLRFHVFVMHWVGNFAHGEIHGSTFV